MPDITGIAPEEMADLTKQFIQKKNVNDRVSIRLRMKAILDYLSTDTEFPPNPLLKKEAPGAVRDGALMGAGGHGIAYAPNQQQAQVWPVTAAEAIPGAQRMDNAEILG